jgi:hypothetical protein
MPSSLDQNQARRTVAARSSRVGAALAASDPDEAFEGFSDDLVSYLGARLGASDQEVLDRLGDCLLETSARASVRT